MEPEPIRFSMMTAQITPSLRQRTIRGSMVTVSLVIWLGASSGCKTTQSKDATKSGATATTVSKPPPRMESEFAAASIQRTSPPTPAFPTPPRGSLLPKDAQSLAAGIPGGDRTYTFSAKGLDLKDALALFAKTFNLNILPDPDINGSVTVDLKDLPLDKVMDALLEVHGYYAEYDKGLIRVKNLASESFTIDYLRLVRTGTGSSAANISSASSSGGSGSSSGSSGGASSGASGGADGAGATISQTDTIKFWEELDEQMKTLVSDKGKFVINRTAGQIFVTDQRASLDRIRTFLSTIRTTLHRQVDIEARIFEVVLNDEFHLGVDWQNIMGKVGEYYINSGGGTTLIPTSRLIVDSPIGGNSPGAPALSLAMGRNQARAVVDALKEMGTLRIVSQPRIRTLNNQAAMIKVGLDKPFFRQTTETTATTGAPIQSSTVEVQIVTIGTILSLTPQISEDGYINLDVSPIITRLVQTAHSADGKTTAPEVDIKQTSSIIRTRSGSTVVIGGLIQDENYSTVRKVPLLGDIPILGRLMTGKYDNKKKTELVIFLTPTVVD
jgi:MSHA biogenesis protein MshL